MKKAEANKLGIFPELQVIEDSGEFLTVYATTKDFNTKMIMIERDQLLKKYQ
ncbi:putative membrane protein [Geobacillus phage TP-84]|uniref:Membrane protein n=1 Tax=Geobacillus phage TP-84 TaxID=1965361 RepID=A0A2D1Q718_9CAUD|nr:hypothetical protein MUK65_gp31 [Geobacillus phage TP-84]ATP06111.1 putative membrane protein [Geobacillus phage TP-84]